MSYGLVLTDTGAAEIESAYHAGKTVAIKRVALGDGGGTALPGTPAEQARLTQLAGEFGSEVFSGAETDEGMISGRIVIQCATYPGKTLREVGLISASGTLIAYGIYPETYIPETGAAVLKEITLTMVLALTHAESVSIEVDPFIAIITQEAGDARYLQRQQNLEDLDDATAARDHLGLGQVGNWPAVRANGGKHSSGNHKYFMDWDGTLHITVDDTDVGELFTTHNAPSVDQVEGAYPKSGGYLDNGASVTVISDPFDGPAGSVFYGPMYRSCLRGRGGDMDFSDGASFFSRAVEAVGSLAYGELVFSGFGQVRQFRFDQLGNIQTAGKFYSGNGASFMSEDANLYGGAWGGYATSWILEQINALNVALNNQISGSINKNNSDWISPNFQLKNTGSPGTGWWRDSATGLIIQAGVVAVPVTGTSGATSFTFPLTFPGGVISVVGSAADQASKDGYVATPAFLNLTTAGAYLLVDTNASHKMDRTQYIRYIAYGV